MSAVKDDGLDNICLNRDFMRAFNNVNFSDSVMVIEILADDARDLHTGFEGDRGEEFSKVIKLHVSSILLAANSPFFRKLFMDHPMELDQRCITLRIHASEETAFMELLKYMYNRRAFAVTSAPVLLDVLKLAEKFQVTSCVRLCTSLLATASPTATNEN